MSDQAHEGIAIVGMAGRFPGAESVGTLWANLVAGRESISVFTDGELRESGLDPEELRRRGQYVAARGVLDAADSFDAAFFGINPTEALVIDPQQRVFLEACWSALEHAGYAPDRIDEIVGVFGGASFNTYYLHALHSRPGLRDLVGPDLVLFGNEKDYLTTRVAYKLGLKGPAINVSTACSTSLVAVCQACQSLLLHQCDVALAGAVSLTFPQARGYYHDEGAIGSADGHTRTFDAGATGTTFSNGVGVVVLKRLDEALRAGDSIYAVIKGAALNNDGAHRVSFAAPGVEGQSEAIAMAHAMADVDPATISYVEAHGTATPLGDPIEVAALTRAFRLGTDRRQFCAIGSLKTNIGHLDVAAGVAGLIKTALSLHHGQLPASLHFQSANARLDLESSPFYVNATLQPWPRTARAPRRAGVSSFGTGGTNAHVVVEEAPVVEASGPAPRWQLLALSAKTEAALERATTGLAQRLQQHAENGDPEDASRGMADAAFTLQTGRSTFAHRRIVACRDAADGAQALEKRDPARVFTHRAGGNPPPIVFMFPGQGAQYAGMGAELYRTEPVFRNEVDRCLEVLRPLLDVDIRTLMFADGDRSEADAALRQTKLTQPALFVVEYALATLWRSWGIESEAMIGHSVGEYVAGCLSGVFSLEDALALVARRGALVQAQPPGSMLAVRLPEHEVLPLLHDGLAIAAINSPQLVVVSGPTEGVAALETRLEADGVSVRHLHTSHAFHSPMMDPVVQPFAELVRSVRLGSPRIPYVSNVTTRWITESEATSPDYWASHVRDTVRFADGLAELMKRPERVLLEVGPGSTLSTLARQHPSRPAGQLVLSSITRSDEERRTLLDALGRLWAAGATVDWRATHSSSRRHRVALPTYPFERTRYWPDDRAEQPGLTNSTTSAAVSASVPHTPASAVEIAAPIVSGQVQPAAQDLPRKHRLVERLRAMLQQMSGTSLEGLDPSVPFLDLGFDSLLLTQVSTKVQRELGVKMTFRQLMEELSSMDALAEWLDSRLPPESMPVAVAGPKGPALQAEPKGSALQDPRARRAGPFGPALPAVGPALRIDTTASTRLTDQQQAFIDALIARYTSRTAGSKRHTQAHRRHFADPRTLAGFRPLWKEMVYPLVVERSSGSRMWDVDGHEYIDFTMGFGTNLLGHSPEFVTEALRAQLARGVEVGPQTPLAGEVARLMCELTGMERCAFCNTGSEAVLAAIRMARAVTGRQLIVYFSGDYHGIFDEVLQRRAGEGELMPIAPGIPPASPEHVLILEYGHPESLETIRARGAEIAAVVVEPVQSRNPDVQPREFLHRLREVTRVTGSALVFDEIITGFRTHPRGAQGIFGVQADIATYGKVIGGGMPLGAVCGRAEYLDALDGGHWQYGDSSVPEKGVTFFAGTYVRHPLAIAAAHAVLTHLKREGAGLQAGLNERTTRVVRDLNAFLHEQGAPLHVEHFASMFWVRIDPKLRFAGLLFFLLRDKGVHIFEGRLFFVSTAHTEEDLQALVTAFKEAVRELQTADLLPRDSSNAAGPKGPADGDGVLPLTEAQQGLHLLSKLAPLANRAYTERVTLQWRGTLDAAVLRSALQELVDRHQALRTTIDAHGETQTVHAHVTIDLELIDVSPFAGDARREALRARCAEIEATTVDPTQAPVFRAHLLRLETQIHLLVLTFHHILGNGPSFSVMFDELCQIYDARREGRSPSLEPAMQLAEYVRWQQDELNHEAVERDRTFWLEQFAGGVPELNLPSDRPRPPVMTYRGSRRVLEIDADLTASLRATGATLRTSLFMTLFAAFNVWLHRLSGQDEVVVGVPFDGMVRGAAGGNRLVANTTNMVPLRSRLGPASFADLAAATKALVVRASEHQAYFVGRLVRDLKIRPDLSRTPLFAVSFNLDSSTFRRTLPGLEVELAMGEVPSSNPRDASKFELTINAIDLGDRLHVDCDFNADLYDGTTVERWLGHFVTLLRGIVDSPTKSIDRLPMLTPVERESLLRPAQETERSLASPGYTLHECFERQAAATPHAIALTGDGLSLTYDELNRRANQIAHHLRAAGVDRDVFVGLYLERSVEMVVGLLGILKAGGAYVPIDPVYPRDRVAFVLDDARVSVLLTRSSLARELPHHPARLVCVDTEEARLAKSPVCNPTPTSGPDDLAYVTYTSGSTGRPKGTLVTHRNVTRLMRSTEPWFGFGPNDVWTLFHSHAFDFSVWELWGALCYGGRLVVVSHATSRSPDDFRQLVEDERVTVLNQTPSAFTQFIDADARADRPGALALRYVVFGGEALDMRSLAPWFERHGDSSPRLVNMYGITETTVHVTYRPLSAADVNGPSLIGAPIPDLRVYVLDQHQEPVPIGVAGEIHVAGAGVARGYLNRDELTRERFVPDTFGTPETKRYRSGDLARRLANGDLEYLGRIDDQVKVRGYRIELGEIEAALGRHDAIRRCVVVAREDASGDKRLVAYLELESSSYLPPVDALRAWLEKTLPIYMVPSAFVAIDCWPLTATGKLDRKALPPPADVRPVTDVPFESPRTVVERQVADIWNALLDVNEIGRRDDFFHLGGDSLLAMRLTAGVHREFGVRVSPAALFQHAVLADFAHCIESEMERSESRRTAIAAVAPPSLDRGSKTTVLFQIAPSQTAGTPVYWVHGVAGEIFSYGPLARHLALHRPVFGFAADWSERGGGVAPTLETIAAHYVRELRRHQPSGPYHLGGYCSGAMLAVEMARQLEAAGARVGLVAAVDYNIIDATRPSSPVALALQFLRNLPRWVREDARPVGIHALVGRGKSRLRELYQRLRSSARRVGGTPEVDIRDRLGMWRFPDEQVPMLQVHHQAFTLYRPKPFGGIATLFQPLGAPLLGPWPRGYDHTWDSLAKGGVDVHHVPGTHLTVLAEPYAGTLARLVNEAIVKSEQQITRARAS